MSAKEVKNALKRIASDTRAQVTAQFFKTGVGEYGEGDTFIGVTMPEQRRIAKKYVTVPLDEVQKLLKSKVHEHRSVGLLILVLRYKKGTNFEKKSIASFYVKNRSCINSWDLVDMSAHHILGEECVRIGDSKKLYTLVKKKSLWERRIGIVSSFAFIKRGELDLTYDLGEILLHDSEDLLHKATGWMLREAGKIDRGRLDTFLQKHVAQMPRTTLRYAIEKHSESERKYWLQNV